MSFDPSTPMPIPDQVKSAANPLPWRSPSTLPAPRHTERLTLRFWHPNDAQGMLDALNVDRGSFLPWLPWVTADNRTLDECRAAIERMNQRAVREDPPADDFVIGIFDRITGLPIGGTGLHRIVHAWHEAEIGYWIRADRRAMGLCTEAVAGVISWAFTPQDEGGWGLRRIHIRCAARNLASQRVPAKLGLRQEGRLVGERWTDGLGTPIPSGWDDTLIWGVLVDEWDTRARSLRAK